MQKHRFRTLRAATAGVLCLTAAACSSKSEPKQQPAHAERTLPSIVNDKPMTSVVPAAKPATDVAAPAPDPQPAPPRTFREMVKDGKAMSARGDHAGAIELLGQAVADEPGSATARIELARAHLAAGDSSSARASAEKAVALAPESSQAWNTLGRVELGQGDRDAAITSFARAADENENNTYAWNNLGLVYLLETRWEEAADALEHATGGDHPTAYMWNNLAIAYEHLDKLGEARAAYRQASELGSDKADASLERLEGVITIAPPAGTVEAPTDSTD